MVWSTSSCHVCSYGGRQNHVRSHLLVSDHWRSYGGSWGDLGGSWGILGDLGGILGGSWGDLGGILGILGGSWGDLDPPIFVGVFLLLFIYSCVVYV